MKKKAIIVLISIVIVLIIGLIFLPLIEINKDNKLYVFTYSDSYGEFEENLCYGESVSYNEKRDISITSWDIKKVLFFYMITMDYEKGNLCDSEYVLEEEYIINFINNAEIIENENNINLSELIEGKTAIVSNEKYPGNDYENAIYYSLDGKEDVLYIYYYDNALVIQVGLSDEGPRYIAYR